MTHVIGFLSNTATVEIEEILGKELNILFAIDIKGDIRRIYSSHFDNTKVNALLQDSNLRTSLRIDTEIPKCEIEEVAIPVGVLHGAHCRCCHSGGGCKTCD